MLSCASTDLFAIVVTSMLLAAATERLHARSQPCTSISRRVKKLLKVLVVNVVMEFIARF